MEVYNELVKEENVRNRQTKEGIPIIGPKKARKNSR